MRPSFCAILIESQRFLTQHTIKALPFPATSANQTFAIPDLPPPRPRRRLPAGAAKSGIPILSAAGVDQPRPAAPVRRPMMRNESAATLFFGPKIDSRSRTNSEVSDSKAESLPRPKMASRHSGDGSNPWTHIQAKQYDSPDSSPSRSIPSHPSDSDEEMIDVGVNSSFQFSVTSGTPSPPSAKAKVFIASKFKPRDLSDDEDAFVTTGYTLGRSASMHIMPASSSSTSSFSDCDDELVTPGVGPMLGSGWPGPDFASNGSLGSSHSQSGDDVEAFIRKTLASARKVSQDNQGGTKKAPGTPVKKTRTFLPIQRPWQSAVANKVGKAPEFAPKKKGAPRKSMPATYGRQAGHSLLDDGSDTEEEEAESPSFRRPRYPALGLGRPSPATPESGNPALQRTRWLMRRSSSGAFSSSSDSSNFPTPTRKTSRGRYPEFLRTLSF